MPMYSISTITVRNNRLTCVFALALTICASLLPRSVLAQTNISADAKEWVQETCPAHFGPSLRRTCIEREVGALQTPGWPSLSDLSAKNQQWVRQTSHFGPSLWRNCVEREVGALQTPGWPSLEAKRAGGPLIELPGRP
jgi:hypothetical protein